MQDRTVAHELGHLFDELSGEIPTAGLNKELATVYNDLNNPTLAQRRELLGSPDVDTSSARNLRNYSPAASGYRGEEAQRELMAEALRAYMADPNYAKTVAPKTAARVREYVNSNPRLRDIIQFNTLAPVGVGVGALGASPEAGAPELPEAATNPLLQLAELPGRSMPTGTAEPIENPRLHQVADLLDAARRHSPLIEHLSPVSLEGSAELLRNFGRERPLANRLLEVANLR